MSLTIGLTFANARENFTAASIARLLLDIQHLSFTLVATVSPDRILLSEIFEDPFLQKYSAFIEMRHRDFMGVEAEIVRTAAESPLWVQFLLNLPAAMTKPVRDVFTAAFDRIFF